MKLLVTGGAGFIGSAVVRQAIARGMSVTNLDALTYAANLANLDSVAAHPRYRFEHVDIRNAEALDPVFGSVGPDAVMHLAAESHVDRSIDAPGPFIETNVMGTANLLQAARRYWTHAGRPEGFRFHHVSTDEVFGSLGPSERFTEESPYAPNSPYAASKAASDHLVRSWHQTFGLPVIMTNSSNTYGPYQFPEKLVPVAILRAVQSAPIPIYGNGENVRDWIHVEDHADALLTVLLKGQAGRRYNIGGGAERRNIDLVLMICAALDDLRPRASGLHADLISFVSDRPGHDQRYAIDPSRLHRELGWAAAHSLEAGLRKTVAWYLANEPWWRSALDRRAALQGTEGAPS